MSRPRIGFAGFTHLGIVSATAMAARGFETVGYGPDRATAAALARAEPPIVEPGLNAALAEHAGRLLFTAELDALAGCDVIYVALDVQTDDSGASDLVALRALIADAARVAGQQATIVVLSQVPPGFTRAYAAADPRFVYQVETLIFGRALERALNPERFIVGCADPARALPQAYAAALGAFGCPILPMRFESAELAKISINMCLVASIGVANTMAELCERAGADWFEIMPALRLDARIGPKSYLTPGLGIAGGNLERDLATVIRLAGEQDTDAGIVKAWIANSRRRRDWALDCLRREVLARMPDPLVAVLGFAYKEDTQSTKNSPSLALLSAVPEIRVRAYDPAVAARRDFHPRLTAATSALDACAGADALAIMTPWAEFRRLDPGVVAQQLRGKVVIDPYRVLDEHACRTAGLVHHVIGRAA